MLKKIIIILACITAALVSGCGGGGSGSDPVKSVKWGYLLPETKGIYYQCGDITGKTGPEGRFEYYEGQDVRFYIGGVELGIVTGAKIVTPFTLAGYDNIPAELEDGSITETELDSYPVARNILHFLLAINELYDQTDEEYTYGSLLETLEYMDDQLAGKTLDFSIATYGGFVTELGTLNAKLGGGKISLGSLNSITSLKISGKCTNLNTTTSTYNTTKPGAADDYGSVDYTGVSNPPINGQILTQAQLNGVWIAEWDIYGDRENNDNPDSAYRDEYVQFPQKNYIVRMDGSQLEEDFICSEYQTFYTFSLTSNPSDMRQARYVKIDGPIASKQTAYSNRTGYPDKIFYADWNSSTVTWDYTEYNKDFFINTWKANNDEYSDDSVPSSSLYRNSIISYSSNSEYAILTFPYVDDFDQNDDIYAGNGQILFSKPVNGRVKVYGIFLNQDGSTKPMVLLRTIRKVADTTINGAVVASWPVD